jgi:hypothetical protein
MHSPSADKQEVCGLSPLSKPALHFQMFRNMIGGTLCTPHINNLSLKYKSNSIIHVMLRIVALVFFTHKSEGCKGQSSTTEQGT